MADMPNNDWRYLRSIQDALIERVSEKMNAEVAAILVRDDITARAKRVKVHEIAQRTHYMIMDCFDHWKRGNMDLIRSIFPSVQGRTRKSWKFGEAIARDSRFGKMRASTG